MILTPFRIRPGSDVLVSVQFFMFLLGLRFGFGLSYVLCSFRLHDFPVMSLVTSQIYVSCFIFHYFPMFPSRALCLIFHFLRLHSYPQPYLIVLHLLYSDLVLVSRSGASACQYIYLMYLYSRTLELILLASLLSLPEVLRNARNLRLSSGHLLSPLFLYSSLRHVFWCGQSIAVCWTRPFVPPSVRPDLVGSERNILCNYTCFISSPFTSDSACSSQYFTFSGPAASPYPTLLFLLI